MVFKLMFVRKSNSSFKIYVIHKHKICFPAYSGQFNSFKFGRGSVSDVFVQNVPNRRVKKSFRDIIFFNNCINDFIKFVGDARRDK